MDIYGQPAKGVLMVNGRTAVCGEPCNLFYPLFTVIVTIFVVHCDSDVT